MTTAASRLELSKHLDFGLQIEFLQELKKHVPCLSGPEWVIQKHELVRKYANLDELYDNKLEATLMQTLLHDLSALGWKVRRKEGAYKTVVDIDGKWPITINSLDGLHLYIWDDFLPEYVEPTGYKAIEAALKAKGCQFTRSNLPGYYPSIKIARAGCTVGSIAKLVSEALGRDMRVNRPAYIDNPWTKTGKTKIHPSQTNFYDIEAGDFRYTVQLDRQKASIIITCQNPVSSWRREK